MGASARMCKMENDLFSTYHVINLSTFLGVLAFNWYDTSSCERQEIAWQREGQRHAAKGHQIWDSNRDQLQPPSSA